MTPLQRRLGKALGADEGGGAVDVGGPEDEHALAFIKEGVEIGNADAVFRKAGDSLGGTARTVVQRQREDRRLGYGKSLAGKDAVRLLRVIAEDAADTVVGRIGQGGGNKLDAGLGKRLEHLHQAAGFVFQENGYLLYGHNV